MTNTPTQPDDLRAEVKRLMRLLRRAHSRVERFRQPYCSLCDVPWDYCEAFGTKEADEVPYG